MAGGTQSSGSGRAVMVHDLSVIDRGCEFCQFIAQALSESEVELVEMDESLHTLRGLMPQCDRLDYALAAASGALCEILDVFLVGKPGGDAGWGGFRPMV